MITIRGWKLMRYHAFYKSLFAVGLMFSLSNNSLGNVKVSNLDDFNFGLYSGFGNLRNDDNLCINSIPVTNYQITFTGSGVGGSFEVSNGFNYLPYIVRFNDRPRRAGGKKVVSGIPLTGRRASDSLNCPTGLNANLDIKFNRLELQAAPPGRYTGLLTVTITPE